MNKSIKYALKYIQLFLLKIKLNAVLNIYK